MVNAHACRLVGDTSATGGATVKRVSRCSELRRGGVLIHSVTEQIRRV